MILIVDDDLDFAESLADILLEECGPVEVSSDGEDAFKKVRADNIKVVLLDIRMPNMGGIEALKAIKKIRPDIYVVMMTGFTMESLISEAREEGADEILFKPLDIDKTIKIVKEKMKVV